MTQTTPPRCVVTAVTAARVDLTELWRAHGEGEPGWPAVTRLTTALSDRLVDLARGTLERSRAEPARVSLLLGSLYGTGHVAESIRQRLDAKGARWLDPEAFLHFTPHGMTASLCMRLGLAGYAATLLGPAAGIQTVAQAVRRIRVGGDPSVLCGAFDFLSPAAAARVGDGEHATGTAAFLLVEAREEARRRDVGGLAGLRSVEIVEEAGWCSGAAALPPGSAASGVLATLAERLREPGSEGRELTVEAPGARARYRIRLVREPEGNRG
ncbi:hypothetical protein ACQEU5_22340 [Marinactinospora thermotolerans]|uniref:Beta-ketoacyl synthase, N-terminal domain n=2 Tax=Marinactinospora thermotolerans TaxID=531310 RepID=A0A1T4T409_9ACTN|nr:hypothetical protein [Marinactinospora thermotolerans]AET51856.1 putative uncharacterized protein [Marinactinospora thermotolerans]SKA35212.1 hypothetical protein SAMN02745673_04434 [Marinactinospora thermotolerans DSM 45154]